MDALPLMKVEEQLSIAFPLNKNIIVEKYMWEITIIKLCVSKYRVVKYDFFFFK